VTTLLVCIKRRAGLSREDFNHYWRDVHGPLIRSCPEFLRYLRSYNQFHFVDANSPIAGMLGVESAYDGVAELTFNSPEAMAAAFNDPSYLEHIRPDEPNFVDVEGCLSFVTERRVVHCAGSEFAVPGAKLPTGQLRLHGYPVSNYFNIVRAALLEKRIPCEIVPSRAGQDPEVLAKSAMGKIPVLETAEGWLAETIAILEYLEDVFPEPNLYPPDAFSRARARQVINVVQMYVEAPARSLYPGVFMGGANDPATVTSAKQTLERAARALVRLVAPAPYLLGDRLTYTDLFAYYSLDLADRVTRTTYGESFVDQVGLGDWARLMSGRGSTRSVVADFKVAFPAYLIEKGAAYRGDARVIGEPL
jgi:glutathione S-transferase